jgi:hypothetical protein
MKHVKFLFAALLCLMVSTVCFADDVPIPVNQLPAAAQSLVQKNFKGRSITYAEKDRDSYECRLDDGTEIEFTKKGDWKKVECKGQKAVPSAFVPAAIQLYVKNNYPKCVITTIEKKRNGYEVELSNDIDLKFNSKGAFVGIDD